nr:PREDICTED: uncharacterized protein LOC105678976 [Linepithema humile]
MKSDGKVSFTALCLQTSNIRFTPHEIKGDVSPKGILSCTCSCKAGLREKCKHIIAVLLYCYQNSDKIEVLSCTDKECEWKKKHKKVLQNYNPVPLSQHELLRLRGGADSDDEMMGKGMGGSLPPSSLPHPHRPCPRSRKGTPAGTPASSRNPSKAGSPKRPQGLSRAGSEESFCEAQSVDLCSDEEGDGYETRFSSVTRTSASSTGTKKPRKIREETTTLPDSPSSDERRKRREKRRRRGGLLSSDNEDLEILRLRKRILGDAPQRIPRKLGSTPSEKRGRQPWNGSRSSTAQLPRGS